jgi:hypothetical protein
MSALPPKADICSVQAHVRFVPKADIEIEGDEKKNPGKFPGVLIVWKEQ